MADGKARKTILITGASSGIGAAVARELAKLGHDLAITARRLDRLERLAAEFEALGASVLILPAALDDPETPDRLISATLDRFGKLDVLINNAGHGLPSLFRDSDPLEIRRQFEVNLVAPVLLAHRALPALVATRGTIINVGSAITAVPNPIFGVYGTTKAALAWWNDALRRELVRQGVNVCLVEPGPVETEFFHALRDQAPEATGRLVHPPPGDPPRHRGHRRPEDRAPRRPPPAPALGPPTSGLALPPDRPGLPGCSPPWATSPSPRCPTTTGPPRPSRRKRSGRPERKTDRSSNPAS